MLKPLTKEQTDSILSIAAEEFAEKGFAGTAVSSIAKRVGVSVGVIYKYYAGKEDLFNACVAKSLRCSTLPRRAADRCLRWRTF